MFLFCEMVKTLALNFFKFLPNGILKSSSLSPTNCASWSRIVSLRELSSLSYPIQEFMHCKFCSSKKFVYMSNNAPTKFKFQVLYLKSWGPILRLLYPSRHYSDNHLTVVNQPHYLDIKFVKVEYILLFSKRKDIPSTIGLVEVSCSKRPSCARAEDKDPWGKKLEAH